VVGTEVDATASTTEIGPGAGATGEVVGGQDHELPAVDGRLPEVPTATREAYAGMIAELGQALRLIRAVEITGEGKIRVSKTVLAAGPILCGACGIEFTTPDPDPDPDPDGSTEGEDGDEEVSDGDEPNGFAAAEDVA
jgi:hypothetical protein